MYGAPMNPNPRAGYGKLMRDFHRHGGMRSNRTLALVLLLVFVPTFVLLRNSSVGEQIQSYARCPGSSGSSVGVAKPPAPGALRVAMIAFITSPQSYLFLTLKNRSQYARRHGLDFYVDYESHSSRGTTWLKLDMVERVIRERTHDWIWYLDMDALITNSDIDIRNVIQSSLELAARPKDVDFIVNNDCNGLNSGSFIARSSARTIQIIDEIRHVHDVEMKTENWLDDQGAYQVFLAGNHSLTKHVHFVPQNMINGFPSEIDCRDDIGEDRTWRKGDLVLHFAGAWAHLEGKKDPVGILMRKYEDQIIWAPKHKHESVFS